MVRPRKFTIEEWDWLGTGFVVAFLTAFLLIATGIMPGY